ncbi:MAG: xanthine dehydrogenase family protein molybdopterin-binding subunit [Conexivisphaera sp.]
MSRQEERAAFAVGRSVVKADARDRVRGSPNFPTDLALEGMLHGKVLRSPHPHARILRVDASAAASAPGVRAVLTARDVPFNRYGAVVQDIPVLAEDVVRYVGEPVALVAAETEEAAEMALELIHVDYEPLPAVSSVEEALRPGAPKLHPGGNVAWRIRAANGDPHTALENAAVVVEGAYRTQFQKHMYLEPEGGVAWVEEGFVNLVVGGQNPYRDRVQVARALGVSPERVRVVSYPVGGAFGGKDDVTVQIHLALLAARTGRPVRMEWTREESGAAGYHRMAYEIEVRTGATREGRLVANVARILGDNGAYVSFGPTMMELAVEAINGPYRIPNYDIEGILVYTNNGISSAMRGFGAPEAGFALESQINRLAEELGMDRLELRRINALSPGEPGPFGVPVEQAPAIQELLDRAPPLRRPRPGDGWTRRGIGVALGMKSVGYGAVPDYPVAAIEVDPRARSVRAYISSPDYGQGLATGCAQLVAEALQLPVSAVEVVDADTSSSPDTGGSSASRGLYAAGNALISASRAALNRLALEASRLLGVQSQSIEYAAGSFRVREEPGLQGAGPGRSIDIFEAAASMAARGSRPRFEATFEVPRVDRPLAGARELPHLVYSFALAVAEVDVDLLTSTATARRIRLIVDAGRVVNPQLAAMQVEGAAIQGVGFALMEELSYRDGFPLNVNFTTYVVPTAPDVPAIEVEFLDGYEESGPYGAKGVGEVGIVPIAAAIADAIADATGARPTELPANAERLSRLLARHGVLPGRLSALLGERPRGRARPLL